MNVLWNWCYSKRYYLTHPWKFFSELWSNLKAGWMRATKGYCYGDVWNLDRWLTSILPPMLRHMADHGSAYPGSEPFNSPEEWHDWLHSVADVMETIYDDDYWWEKKNEYHDEWEALTDYYYNSNRNITMTGNDNYDYSPEHFEEVKRLYSKRMREIAAERQQIINNVFNEIAHALDCLWD